jgi:hypothetical protein
MLHVNKFHVACVFVRCMCIRENLNIFLLQLGRGDYDPLSTRVVHMVENLDFKSEKQVLLAEIQSLREKLKSVEDNRLNEGTIFLFSINEFYQICFIDSVNIHSVTSFSFCNQIGHLNAFFSFS